MSVRVTPGNPAGAIVARESRRTGGQVCSDGSAGDHRSAGKKQLILLVLIAFSVASAADPWVAPRSAARRQNPIQNTAKSVAAGKAVFMPNCVPCHGEAGRGDGPASTALNPKPANLTDPKVWEQTDGAIFWKISNGRNAMPKWEGALSEEQRWHTINFLRTTFGKPHP